MMFHPVQPSLNPLPVDGERLSQGRSNITHLTGVLHAIPHQLQTGSIPQCEERLTPQVRAWITGDGKVVDLPGRYPCHIETHVDRLVRKPCPVLHPSETFLLDSSYQGAVAEKNR